MLQRKFSNAGNRLWDGLAQPSPSSSRLECLVVAIVSLALGFLFSAPILSHLDVASSFGDWDFNLELAWVPYWTVRHFHQLPLWNPYKCGGILMLGNPQSRILSPFFLLHLIAGPVVGLHLEIPLHFAIAWAGGYVLGRVLGMTRIGAATTATAFPASSWFCLHVAEGHMVLLPIVYMTWFVAIILLAAACRSLSWAVLAGAILALTFFEGTPYSTVLTLALAAVVVGVECARSRSLAGAAALVEAGVIAAGLSALKSIPAWEFVRRNPRSGIGGYQGSIRILPAALMSHAQQVWHPVVNGWGFWETGAYVGVLGILAVIGIFAGRRAIAWIAAALAMAAMYCGFRGTYWPWALMHRLPALSTMMVPSRSRIPMVLAIGVLAGFGMDSIMRRAGGYAKPLALTILAAATIDCLSVDWPALRYVYAVHQSTYQFGTPAAEFRQFSYEGHFREYSIATLNEGAPRCYEYTDIKSTVTGFNEKNYRGETFLLGPGVARTTRWSPNVLEYEVDALAGSILTINQNYDSGWRLAGGQGGVFSRDSLLAVRLPTGTQRIVLRYRPASVIIGAIVTIVTITACGVIIVFGSRTAPPRQASTYSAL